MSIRFGHQRSRGKILAEALGIGAVFGFAHTFAETILLVFYGVRLTALDSALFLVVAVATGLAVGLAAGLAAMASPFPADPLRLRQLLLGPDHRRLFADLRANRLLWDGWLGTPKAILLAAPILVLASAAVVWRGRSALVLFFAAISVAVTLTSLQLVHSGWQAIRNRKPQPLRWG